MLFPIGNLLYTYYSISVICDGKSNTFEYVNFITLALGERNLASDVININPVSFS